MEWEEDDGGGAGEAEEVSEETRWECRKGRGMGLWMEMSEVMRGAIHRSCIASNSYV